jgi:phage gpG-like protein
MAPRIEFDWRPMPLIAAGAFMAFADELGIKSYREPLKRSIQQVIGPAFRGNFDSAGDGKWEPLASSTEEQKARKHGSKGPLVRTGKRRKRAEALALWNIDGQDGTASAENLAGVEYGAAHVFGTVRMPARDWTELTPAEMDKIEEVFGTWIEERAFKHMAVFGA